ncbi:unnamed protein product [Rotaria sordida]|uniref:Uncharacterized protein n=1 Tax=Rotaria sordida TaxID=392033 RepID=A0A814XDL9_9BILA|nr:unnamed protein product [Rotaria sordida]CAF1215055.1 unnamed protein product [Rotaria sordida]CAF3970548.1 unnamed protein product [Rotaria sordida]
MLSIFSFNRSVSFHSIFTLLTSTIRHSTSISSDTKSNEDAEHHHRLATTRRMRILGLQSNQARRALSIYDDYVYQQKKLPDLRMLGVAINCAMIAEDLAKGREIHQFIEHNFPHLKDNLMLKQQLRYFYIKCNDKLSADKLFQQTSTIKHTQQNQKQTINLDSNQIDKN